MKSYLTVSLSQLKSGYLRTLLTTFGDGDQNQLKVIPCYSHSSAIFVSVLLLHVKTGRKVGIIESPDSTNDKCR